jgi:hypothetical protein
MPPRASVFKENDQAVHAHLSIAQSVIQRMATNSAACKTWCITLVSAILVIVMQGGKPTFSLLALLPTVLFFFLDTYYLSLEQRCRNSYNSFIDKLHSRKIVAEDLYAVVAQGKPFPTFVQKFLSFAIWPFYVGLTAVIVFFDMWGLALMSHAASGS